MRMLRIAAAAALLLGTVYRITEATGDFASLQGGELMVPGPLSTSLAGAVARVPILVSSATLADANADLDGDGTVGLADLAIFKRFLFRAPGPAAPPTP